MPITETELDEALAQAAKACADKARSEAERGAPHVNVGDLRQRGRAARLRRQGNADRHARAPRAGLTPCPFGPPHRTRARGS